MEFQELKDYCINLAPYSDQRYEVEEYRDFKTYFPEYDLRSMPNWWRIFYNINATLNVPKFVQDYCPEKVEGIDRGIIQARALNVLAYRVLIQKWNSSVQDYKQIGFLSYDIQQQHWILRDHVDKEIRRFMFIENVFDYVKEIQND